MSRNPLSRIVIDSGTGCVYHDGRVVRLSRYEFELFRAMWMRRVGRCTHEGFHVMLYGMRLACDRPKDHDGSIWVLICRLRRHVAPLGIGIESVWGYGYKIVIPEAVSTNNVPAAA